MKKKIIIFLGIIALIFVLGMIETFFIVETELTLNGQLKGILKNKTIIHLSDLHIKSIGKKEKELLKIVNKIEPDMVFLTGDYVKWNGDYKPAMKFLSKLKAKIGIWAVMGDYDYSNSRKSCLYCHKAGSGERTQLSQVRFLKNSEEILELGGRKILVLGVDEIETEQSRSLLKKWGSETPAIILSHNPLNYDFVDESNDVLILAGDTHGGQVPLPSLIWRLLGYDKNEKYNYGLYEDGQKKMFVTRGIGTSHLPIRLFCTPEVVVIRF